MKNALNDKLRELRAGRDNVVKHIQATRHDLEGVAMRKDVLQGKLSREIEREKDLLKQLQEQQNAYNIAQGILDFVAEVITEDRQNEHDAQNAADASAAAVPQDAAKQEGE